MNTYPRMAVVAVAVAAIGLAACAGGQAEGPSRTPSPSATEATTSATSVTPDPQLNQTFTSTRHGISLSYPEDWNAQAATEPWTESTFPLSFGVPQVDFLSDPALTSDLFLAIASQPIGNATADDWIGAQMASEEGCGTATEPVTVDGASGLIGVDGCTTATVAIDGRGYWIQLYTGDSAPATYDSAWFEKILSSVRLWPEDAVD